MQNELAQLMRDTSYLSYESEPTISESGFESDAMNLLSDVQEDDEERGKKLSKYGDRNICEVNEISTIE